MLSRLWGNIAVGKEGSAKARYWQTSDSREFMGNEWKMFGLSRNSPGLQIWRYGTVL